MLNRGDSASASLIVKDSDTARALALSSEDNFPAVFATSRMVALMELAAARAMRSVLEPGQLSVGVSVNVRHTAATPIGSTVRAVATFQRQDGKTFDFRIEAFDDAGPIGEGEHTRALIDTQRLLSGAERRRGTTPAP